MELRLRLSQRFAGLLYGLRVARSIAVVLTEMSLRAAVYPEIKDLGFSYRLNRVTKLPRDVGRKLEDIFRDKGNTGYGRPAPGVPLAACTAPTVRKRYPVG